MHRNSKRALAAAVGIVATLAAVLASAEGTTEGERTMSRYKHCRWTDEMSRQVYECVKKNDGFGTHWCFDETVQTHCQPDPVEAAPKKVADTAAAPGSEEDGKRAARMGEENLRGTIEREKTMLRYKDCPWTDEMGKYVYECVKRNDGFGVHWCHDEALQLLCPKPAEPKS